VDTVQIIYTRHARKRMQQRGISAAEVEETLEFPDEILSGDNGEEIAVKQYGNRELRVVFAATTAETVLIYTVIKPKIKRR